MSIEFKKVSSFRRGTLFELLKDVYSFDIRYEDTCRSDWQLFDDFFFDNPELADKCGFITTLDDEPIGFISWDPRNMPESCEIGFNGISSKYKGKGYGRMQIKEAVSRILRGGAEKVIVTTDKILVPAQHTYEGAGFEEYRRRKNEGRQAFSGDFIDYVYEVK